MDLYFLLYTIGSSSIKFQFQFSFQVKHWLRQDFVFVIFDKVINKYINKKLFHNQQDKYKNYNFLLIKVLKIEMVK